MIIVKYIADTNRIIGIYKNQKDMANSLHLRYGSLRNVTWEGDTKEYKDMVLTKLDYGIHSDIIDEDQFISRLPSGYDWQVIFDTDKVIRYLKKKHGFLLYDKLMNVFSSTKSKVRSFEYMLDNITSSIPLDFDKRTIVYVLIKNNNIIYIGITSSIFQRLNTHKKDKSFDKIFLDIIPAEYGLLLEAMYIEKYTPEFNKHIPNKKSLLKTAIYALEPSLYKMKGTFHFSF